MKEEIISDIYDKFITIVNRLKNLGRAYHQEDLNRSILMSLPPRWILNITTIEESKYLSELSIDDMILFLLTDENGITEEKVGAQRLRRKTITLKIVNFGEDDKGLRKDEVETTIVSLGRILVKFRNKNMPQKSQKKLSVIYYKSKKYFMFFEYMKLINLKIDCPSLKQNYKEKGNGATQSDDNDNSSEREEEK